MSMLPIILSPALQTLANKESSDERSRNRLQLVVPLPTASMMTMQQEPMLLPPLQQHFSSIDEEKTSLTRGPLLWLLGCSVWIGCVYMSTEGFSIVPPPSTTTIVTGIATLFLWTVCCVLITGKDVYDHLIERVSTLLRATTTTTWSLDDVLRAIYDPQQLVAHIVQFTTLSVSLYTLPTTPEQRAQAFQHVGLLPPGEEAVDLFAAPGGWMQLLLRSGERIAAVSEEEREEEDSMAESATIDGDNELHYHTPPSPYSISPIYREAIEEQQHQQRKTATTVSLQATTPDNGMLLQADTIQALFGSILYAQARELAGPAALTIATVLAARYSSRLRWMLTTAVAAASCGAVWLQDHHHGEEQQGTLLASVQRGRQPAWKGTLLVLLIWLFRRRGVRSSS